MVYGRPGFEHTFACVTKTKNVSHLEGVGGGSGESSVRILRME